MSRAALKLLARLVGVAGAVAVGWTLLGRGPKDVVLVYDLASVPGARSLEVEVLRDGDVLRRAAFRLARGEGRVTHALQLPEGGYVLRGRFEAPAGATRWERPLEIHESGTIVLPVGR